VSEVTVAIPVRDGGRLLGRTLRALDRQTVTHELLVCDSGSRDGSRELARAHGARVLEIDPSEFSHGGTRNLLMRESCGAHVAFLTQDAEPADEHWLEALLGGFALAEDVALVYGPYIARPEAPFAVRSELRRWFESLSPDGAPSLQRLDPSERQHAQRLLHGRRGFFTDANGCVAKSAWERVPFRDIAYAEDRALALDLMRAGYAICYEPHAPVVHSHHYTPLQQLRRSFDEGRALHEVFGAREPGSPRAIARRLRGELRVVVGELQRGEEGVGTRVGTLAAVTSHQLTRAVGGALGSRADSLPRSVRRELSLERRDRPAEPPERPGGEPRA
jgi:rhamnosyltransferase